VVALSLFRKQLDVIVPIFQTVLFVFLYALKREYWEGIY